MASLLLSGPTCPKAESPLHILPSPRKRRMCVSWATEFRQSYFGELRGGHSIGLQSWVIEEASRFPSGKGFRAPSSKKLQEVQKLVFKLLFTERGHFSHLYYKSKSSKVVSYVFILYIYVDHWENQLSISRKILLLCGPFWLMQTTSGYCGGGS